MISIYLNQDIFNPEYLFYGSPYTIDVLEPRQSFDNINPGNEDCAIFLTSWFLNTCAYAFRNKLKEVNESYSFLINNDGKLPVMDFDVDIIPNDLKGYIYVFKKSKNMIRDDYSNIDRKTTQYKCYQTLKPIDIIEVKYEDYKEYFNKNEKIR